MPIELFEVVKLLLSIFIIIFPGYLWSFIFFNDIKKLERIIFGFIISICILILSTYLLNILLKVKITQSVIFLLYSIFTIPIVIIFLLSIYKLGFPNIKFKPIELKYSLLIVILVIVFFIYFLPHIINNHFLPFHVDEWVHWSYSRSIIESGQTTFINPFTGAGYISSLRVGFHISTATFLWFSGTDLITIFLIMPAIIGIFISITAFNIGEKSKRNFSLEAAFLTAFIPTTVRYLGPKFYVPVAFGILLFIFIIWLVQLKKFQAAVLLFPIIFLTFIIHAVSALACIIFILSYSLFLLFEKKYRLSLSYILFSIFPIIISVLISSRWNIEIDRFLYSISGKEYLSNLPEIWLSFEHIGILIWVFFIIGSYLSFTKGYSTKKALTLSAIIFIMLIGLYSQFRYGYPIIYDRMFLFLFVCVILIAGFGLSEIKKYFSLFLKNKRIYFFKKKIDKKNYIFAIFISILILIFGLQAHISIPYYRLINEKDFETYTWIYENIENYENYSFADTRAAVNPFKASSFSAVSGLYIISSSVHPLYSQSFSGQMQEFLSNNCTDTNFLDRYHIGVIYGNCDNSNLTKIYDKVYIYPGLFEK